MKIRRIRLILLFFVVAYIVLYTQGCAKKDDTTIECYEPLTQDDQNEEGVPTISEDDYGCYGEKFTLPGGGVILVDPDAIEENFALTVILDDPPNNIVLDQEGRLKQVMQQHWMGDYYPKFEYIYDEDTGRLSQILQQDSFEEITPNKITTYKRNERGDKTEVIVEAKEKDEENSTKADNFFVEKRITVEYDESGNRLLDRHYDKDDKLIETHSYLYEGDKRIGYEIKDEESKTIKYREDYTYDENGNLVTVINHIYGKGGDEVSLKSEFYYDENGIYKYCLIDGKSVSELKYFPYGAIDIIPFKNKIETRIK